MRIAAIYVEFGLPTTKISTETNRLLALPIGCTRNTGWQRVLIACHCKYCSLPYRIQLRMRSPHVSSAIHEWLARRKRRDLEFHRGYVLRGLNFNFSYFDE